MPYNHSIKAASPSGTAYTGRADGIFSLNEQVRFKSSGLWATAVSIPGAPTSVTAVGGNAQAIVSFTAPASNGGSAITSYTVTSSSGQTATRISMVKRQSLKLLEVLDTFLKPFLIQLLNQWKGKRPQRR